MTTSNDAMKNVGRNNFTLPHYVFFGNRKVKSLREEVSAGESRMFYLNCMKTVLENQSQRSADEVSAYMSSDPSERKKTYR